MKNKVRTRKLILIAGGTLSVLIVLAGLIHQAGFVFSGVYIVKGGSLEITQALPNSAVFVDEKRRGTVAPDGTTTINGIRPGVRSVIVSHDTTWPWILDIHSSAGTPNSLIPLQVRKEARGATLSDAQDPLYISAQNEFKAYGEPTRFNPLSRNGVIVWVDGTTIYKQENGDMRTIFASVNPIRNVFWYGDRNDAIIVATQNVVVALDLRGREVQNFLPLYTGNAPEAVSDSIRSSHIFVRDADTLFTIEL